MSLGAIGGYGYDPYFMAAYQSYNPNFQATNQAPDTTQTVQQGLATNDPTFRGKKKEEENSGSAASLIVGGALAIGTGVLLYKAHKKGGEKGILEGLKQMWKGVKGKVSNVTNPAKSKTFSYQEINGQKIVTIPNRTNRIQGDDIASKLQTLGYNNNAAEIINNTTNKLNKGIKIHSGQYFDGKIRFSFKGNEVVKYETLVNGKWVDTIEPNNINPKEVINNTLTKIRKGEELDKVTNLKYSHTENGLTKVFTQANKDANAELEYAITNRFAIDDVAVNAYRYDNKNVDDALKALEKGDKNGWKIAKADYVSQDIGTVHIENGKIIGLTVESNGKKQRFSVNSDTYKELCGKYPTTFENILKAEEKDLTNIVRTLA